MVLGELAEKQIVPIVVMQTIAANLGSMLTPIGNPQNLYLYGKASMNFGEFILFMLPYTLVAFVVADYVTGVLRAGVERKLSSTIGFRGIARKIMIFILVGVAHLIDTLVVLIKCVFSIMNFNIKHI